MLNKYSIFKWENSKKKKIMAIGQDFIPPSCAGLFSSSNPRAIFDLAES